MQTERALPLFWRVLLLNGAVFLLGTAALVASPATVSSRPVLAEAVILTGGLGVMLVANALLLRLTFRPLHQLAGSVEFADGLADVPVPRAEPAQRIGRAVNGLLDRIAEEQRSAALQALTAQEAERSRIAQELHDGVGQSLTVALLALGLAEQASDDERSAALTRARDATRDSLDQVKAVARRLRPHVLDELGLRSALASVIEDLFGAGDVAISRGFSPALPHLDEATELVLFRVAQEALTNVARHARAGKVEVTLAPLGSEVELVITDDGIGSTGAVEGTGVAGMRDRAALVGGELTVSGAEGGGTRVRLLVPGVVR